MGSLVARAALTDAEAARKVRRLVTLGTLHSGSFAPVQALDGTNPAAPYIDTIDRTRDAGAVAAMLAEFPGLAMLLPHPEVLRTPDFALAENWPHSLPRPGDDLLREVAAFRDGLGGRVAGVETIAIVGTGEPTAVGASVIHTTGTITYTMGDGDGTVPLRSAAWPQADCTYYLDEEHGRLPTRRKVAAAIAAILERREPELATKPPAPMLATRMRMSQDERALPRAETCAGVMAALEVALRPFVAKPDGADAASAATSTARAGAPQSADSKRPALFRNPTRGRYIAGAGSPIGLEIQLRHGNLLDCSADCYALGLFAGVDPAGAALAIDAEMEGAVGRMVAHRMLASGLGEITVLPSRDSGIDVRRRGTALGARWQDADPQQRLILLDERKAAEHHSAVGRSRSVQAIAVVNTQRYGGPGGATAVTSCDPAAMGEVLVHELGHSLFKLGDEYVDERLVSTMGEPVAANVTGQFTPATLKWRPLVSPGAPLPTPPTAPDAAGRRL